MQNVNVIEMIKKKKIEELQIDAVETIALLKNIESSCPGVNLSAEFNRTSLFEYIYREIRDIRKYCESLISVRGVSFRKENENDI